jgi:hypothetical protein
MQECQARLDALPHDVAFALAREGCCHPCYDVETGGTASAMAPAPPPGTPSRPDLNTGRADFWRQVSEGVLRELHENALAHGRHASVHHVPMCGSGECQPEDDRLVVRLPGSGQVPGESPMRGQGHDKGQPRGQGHGGPRSPVMGMSADVNM